MDPLEACLGGFQGCTNLELDFTFFAFVPLRLRWVQGSGFFAGLFL